jgi:hypothetical protein
VVVTGGTGPFTYTFTGVNGALVELNSSSGRITVKAGLPVGTYYETITATDSFGFTDSIVVTIQVNDTMTLSIVETVTNTLGQTTPYTVILSLTGGTDTKTYSITNLSVPSGQVTINSATGVVTISGALPAGTYVETVTVTDVSGSTASDTFTITVNSAVDISAGSNIVTTIGRSESSTAFEGIGGTGTKTFSISANANGITINPTSGVVTVSATVAGTFTETVTVTDALGAASETRIVVTVNPLPVLTAKTGLGSTFGNSFTFTPFTQTGGSAPFTYSLSQNIDSFTINAQTGVVTVSGSLATGSYTFSVTVVDQFGFSDTKSISFTVNSALAITAPADETSTAGFTRVLPVPSATGGTGTKSFSLASTPAGFSISALTGAVTIGTSATEGSYTLTIRVTDSAGVTAEDGVIIIISAAMTLSIVDSVIITTQGRSETRTTISASGGTGTLQYSISPTISGISINATTGELTIANTLAANDYNESVTVTDSLGYTKTIPILIKVNAKAQVTGSETLTTTAGITKVFPALTSSGGTGAVTFALTGNASGTIAENRSGFSISDAGVVTVLSSLAAGTYTIYVKVTDSLGISTVRTLRLVVNAVMQFSNLDTVTSTLGRSYTSPSLTISGGSSGLTFTISAGGSGATINSGTGAITVPSSLGQGTYFETVTVTDAVGALSETLVAIVINPLPTLSGPTTLTTTRGLARLSTAFTGALGTSPYTFSITGGANGITINNSTRQVRVAETTAAGTYVETVTLTDARGAQVQETITILVNDSISVTQGSNIVTTYGRAETSLAFTSIGGTGQSTLSMNPIRSEVTFDASTGEVSVSASLLPGTYYETITATDSLGETGIAVIQIKVNDSITILNRGALRTTLGFTRTSETFTASGGTGDKTFTLSGFTGFTDRISVGLTSGRITASAGLPVGTYNGSIIATDSLGVTATLSVEVIVADTVVLGGGSNISTTKGVARSSTAFQASNGTETITYTLSNPPVGITINPLTGVVTVAETVIATGIIYETVTATDVMGSSDSRSITITIFGAISISGDTQLVTTRGRAESTSVYSSSGGAGGNVYSISPTISGITIDPATGRVTVAKTTAAGVYQETITVTDSETASASLVLTITVNRELSIAANTQYATTIDTSRTFAAFTVESGTGTRSFQLSNTNAFASINSSGQLILTMPPTAGNFAETVTVTDSLGETATLVITIIVNPALVISGSNLIKTTINQVARETYTVDSGTGTKSWAIASAVAENGSSSALITINSSTGALTVASGTPVDTYTVTIRATDQVGAIDTHIVTVQVNAALSITGGSNITTTFGRAESSTPHGTSGGTAPFTWSIDGTATTGLSVDSVTGIIYVTGALVAGTYNRTLRVTDTSGATATKSFRVTVNAALTVTQGSDIATTYLRPGQSTAFGRAGGTGQSILSMTPINLGVTFTLSNESTSLVVLVDGTLAPGTYYETITATDSLGETGTKLVTIRINETLTIVSGSDIETTRGISSSSTAFSSGSLTGTGTKTYSIFSVVDSSGATRSASDIGLTVNDTNSGACRYLHRDHSSHRCRRCDSE